jgi:acetylornithine/N-succinyldiaminopimelate aminotransferase
MDSHAIIDLYGKFVIPCYSKTPLVIERGEGIHVWDAEGHRYLDFFPGWAVSGIGHCHPRVVAALRDQAGKLIHVSNNYYHRQQAQLAEALIQEAFPGKAFFCNSGAEANEAAFKLARKFGAGTRYEIITMERAFHGRTIAAVTATGQKKHMEGFEPLLPGFVQVPFNDLEAVRRAITPKTVAVMLEPIQGEGGIRVASRDFFQGLRQLCTDKNILMIVDEVQTGMGRTGRMFCFQHYGITPDVMTLAKSLGGGFPMGALIAGAAVADLLQPGTHATTFGGSPLACAAALATIEAIRSEGLLDNAQRMGEQLWTELTQLKKKHPAIREVRGLGVMTGIELGEALDGKTVYEACLSQKLLINCTQGNVLRLMPPMTVTSDDIHSAMTILDAALTTCARGTHG